MISPIDGKDVSRITSGQVIIELVSAVKELIDNSIDAGANKIEVTFAEHAAKYLEVVDNGCGIDPLDYEALCLKYHTSKLSSFEDLSGVSSLGFRGEAMSSLCSVATVTVKTSSQATFPKANLLLYDSMGKLVSQKTSVTGQKGTTVTMTNLFHELPVRHKNFIKNSKREYTKALALIVAYLLAYTSIRFTVYSIGTNSKRHMVLGTPGGQVKLADVMVSVYGSHGAYGLLPVDFKVDKIETRFKLNLDHLRSGMNIRLRGTISGCSFGMGRSGTDRQFLSINRRPVVHKRLAKVINEVYKSFNTTQSPTFVLDLETDPHFLDVNVTPDKRSVMIQAEDLILDAVRDELSNFYEKQSNSVPKSKLGTLYLGSPRLARSLSCLSSTSRNINLIGADVADESKEAGQSIGTRSLFPATNEDEELKSKLKSVLEPAAETETEINKKQVTLSNDADSFVNPETRAYKVGHICPLNQERPVDSEDAIGRARVVPRQSIQEEEHNEYGVLKKRKIDSVPKSNEDRGDNLIMIEEDMEIESYINNESEKKHAFVEENEAKFKSCRSDISYESETSSKHLVDTFEDLNDAHLESLSASINTLAPNLANRDLEESNLKEISSKKSSRSYQKPENPLYTVRATFTIALEHLHVKTTTIESGKLNDSTSLQDITQVMEIFKQDFTSMKVVGQFNSGFIIVTHNNRLFIVDQHALDEIYNYERLMKTLVLRAQPLVAPRTLELSPIDEIHMLEFSVQLRKNGFQLEENEYAPPGRKVRLLAVPMLKNVVFDDGDLHELVNKLQEHCSRGRDGVAVRCTKTERTIALRACRLSIMIGQALQQNTMSQVILHLSTLDRPWNCPHGRPTIRHLADLRGQGFQDDYLL